MGVAIALLVVGIAGGYFIGGGGGGAQTRTVTGSTTTVTQPGGTSTVTQTLTQTITQPPVTVTAGGGGLTGTVQIACICPVTGSLASFGETDIPAMKFAVSEINPYLKNIGAKWQLELVVEDTKTDPTVALQKVQELAARGIRLLIGPESSAEVRSIKSYIDSNNILVISHSSTAPGLRIAGDNVLRFVTDDTLQGPAIAKVIANDGIQAIIHVWRGDAWGDGLSNTTDARLQVLGVEVPGAVRYSPDATEFSSEASLLAEKVQAEVDKRGAGKVAVLYDGFDEVVAFFQAASEHAILGSVRWYGSDGTAQSGKLVADPIATVFAQKVTFLNPIFEQFDSGKSQAVAAYVKQQVGRAPESYAYSAYDIMWVYALTIQQTQSTDPLVIKAAIPTVLTTYFGALGYIVLNEAGDLATANYGLWIVRGTEWVKVGTYLSASDSVQLTAAV